MDDPHFPSTPREMSANEKEQHWGENGINMRKRAEWRKDMNMIRSSNVRHHVPIKWTSLQGKRKQYWQLPYEEREGNEYWQLFEMCSLLGCETDRLADRPSTFPIRKFQSRLPAALQSLEKHSDFYFGISILFCWRQNITLQKHSWIKYRNSSGKHFILNLPHQDFDILK